LAVIVVHAIDLVWFLVVLGYLAWLQPTDTPGEISISSNKGVMLTFMAISIVTVAAGLALWWLGTGSSMSNEWRWLFLGCLFGLSVFDFVYLQEYYFDHGAWIEKNTAAG
jgi:hypothetical protein